jgi:DNA-binding GntR family transcriptional regulator
MPANASSTDKPAAKLADPAALASRSEQIRRAVEAEILGGQRLPGDAIDDTALMAAHAVSRTPVREALILLAQQGLVEILPRSGIRVRKPSAAELVALVECLAELEALCAKLAAQRIVPAQRAALQQAQREAAAAAAADDQQRYEAANARFHDTLHAASGNAVLVEQLQAVRKRLAAFRRQVMARPGRLQAASREHDVVLAAVLSGRPDEALAAMREHILRKGSAVAEVVLLGTR